MFVTRKPKKEQTVLGGGDWEGRGERVKPGAVETLNVRHAEPAIGLEVCKQDLANV